jgi:predicted DNA-binding protein (MmcQ/YjbR family)
MPGSSLDLIRSMASKYPEAEKAFLFGDHEVFRVKKKVFVWLGTTDEGGTYLSVKLKDSQNMALMLPFIRPAAYGMAKWGWIDAQFPKGGKLLVELVAQWIDESYRHTAPKKLLEQLDAGAPASAQNRPAPSARAKKAPAPSRAKKRGARRSTRSTAR